MTPLNLMKRGPLFSGVVLLMSVMSIGCDGVLSSLEGEDAIAPGARLDATMNDLDSALDTSSDMGATKDAPDLADMAKDLSSSDMGGGDEMPRPGEHDPNELDQEALFASCQERSSLASPPRLRRLNQLGWLRNTGRARFKTPGAENPLRHDADAPYSTYASGDTLEADLLSAYLDIVGEASKPLVQRQTEEQPYMPYGAAWLYDKRQELGIECMYDGSAQPDATCQESFARTLLERAVYHRPPSQEEVDNLVQFASEELALEQAGERPATLERIISAAWLTTGALFQTELGEGVADAHGRRLLGPFEIAHAVGTALLVRRPGALPTRSTKWMNVQPYDAPVQGHMRDLYLAAEDGSIQDRDTLAALVRAHLSGVQYDADDMVTHIGGHDPERHDIRQEARETYVRRGEYGLLEGVREFFIEYFDYADVNTSLKTDSSKTSKYWQTPGIHDPMYGAIFRSRSSLLGGKRGEANHKEQLDEVIARTVVQDRDVLQNLLTTNTYWLFENDHAHYRMASAQSDWDGSRNVCGGYASAQECAQNEFAWLTPELDYVNAPYGYDELISRGDRDGHWIALPPTERSGVLTHPAWLAAHGANFENDASAIYRGKWIVEHLLCGVIPDVPIAADAQLNPESADKSARFRITEKTESSPYCLSCHEVMNPLGYAFETYNHAGFLRVENHEQDANFGQSTIPQDITYWKQFFPSSPVKNFIPPELQGVTVQDGVALSTILSTSTRARQCFVRHTFRYFMGRPERPEDACTLIDMDQSYIDHGGSFNEMLVTLLTSDTFLYRTTLED